LLLVPRPTEDDGGAVRRVKGERASPHLGVAVVVPSSGSIAAASKSVDDAAPAIVVLLGARQLFRLKPFPGIAIV
jgi:hypothetical protein